MMEEKKLSLEQAEKVTGGKKSGSGFCPYTPDRTCRTGKGGWEDCDECKECGWRAW